MFKNYLLLSLKVLKRKPFYTFISLFGISFTLMILMLLTSLFDATLGDNQPLTHRDRMVMAPMVERIRMEPDTTRKIDTIKMDNGQMRYDTTLDITEEQTSNSNGPMGYKFITENLLPLEEAEYVGIFHDGSHIEGYLDGRKFTFNSYYVNDQYWDVMDFNFLYGSRMNAEDDKQANKVAVITDKSALTYFGEVSESLIGREMLLGKEIFRVRGIIARPLESTEDAVHSHHCASVTIRCAAPDQPDQPEHQPGLRAQVGDWCPQGLWCQRRGYPDTVRLRKYDPDPDRRYCRNATGHRFNQLRKRK